MDESQEIPQPPPKVGDDVRFFGPGRRPVDAKVANVWPQDPGSDLILIDLDYHVVYGGHRCLRREFRVPQHGMLARDYGWKPKEDDHE